MAAAVRAPSSPPSSPLAPPRLTGRTQGGSVNRDEAIELFNEARTAGRDDRLQCLAHVQELVLRTLPAARSLGPRLMGANRAPLCADKEPALLEEFVPAFLELEQDKLAVVRKALVGFVDDVVKQFPQCAPPQAARAPPAPLTGRPQTCPSRCPCSCACATTRRRWC